MRKSLCRDGIRRLGLVRSQKPAPLPKTVSGSHERLPSISPDRLSTDRGTDSPDPFSRNGRYRRSLDEAKMTYTRAASNPKLGKYICQSLKNFLTHLLMISNPYIMNTSCFLDYKLIKVLKIFHLSSELKFSDTFFHDIQSMHYEHKLFS